MDEATHCTSVGLCVLYFGPSQVDDAPLHLRARKEEGGGWRGREVSW